MSRGCGRIKADFADEDEGKDGEGGGIGGNRSVK